jgi:ribonuclease P protein subunit POP4
VHQAPELASNSLNPSHKPSIAPKMAKPETGAQTRSQPHGRSMINDLLGRAHSSSTTAKIINEKITKPLLLEPTVSTDKRALRRHIRERKNHYHLRKQARKGKKPLSAREKRRLGLYALKKEEVLGKLNVYKGLNNMWNGYMLEVLSITKNGEAVEGWEKREFATSNSGNGGVGSLLVSADLHGADMRVVRSKEVGRVACEGIVVRETKFAFVLLGWNDGKERWWTVPKRGSVFRVSIKLPKVDREEARRKVDFEIQGTAFEYRPIERATRKFRFHNFDHG